MSYPETPGFWGRWRGFIKIGGNPLPHASATLDVKLSIIHLIYCTSLHLFNSSTTMEEAAQPVDHDDKSVATHLENEKEGGPVAIETQSAK